MLRPRIRRRCVSLSAAPADSWLHTARDNRDTETMERLVTQNSAQRGRPAVPDQWTGRPGGSGAQPPLHLIYMVKVGRHFQSDRNESARLRGVGHQKGICPLDLQSVGTEGLEIRSKQRYIPAGLKISELTSIHCGVQRADSTIRFARSYCRPNRGQSGNHYWCRVVH